MRCNIDRSGYLEFDKVAKLYDSARPGYPNELYQKIIEYAELGPNDPILEIGCGTGQATFFFASAGFNILALDPGANLLDLAKENLVNYQSVEFICEKFEEAQLPRNKYSLIFSATAFHWLEPEIAYKKAYECLRPGGSLALFWNLMPEPDTAVKTQLSAIFNKHENSLAQSAFGNRDNTQIIADGVAELEATGLFRAIENHVYKWEIKLTASGLTNLLKTFSNFQVLPAKVCDALYADIEMFVNQKLSGEITLNYCSVLNLARKNL
jgi:SAM-dependent methyltransferase